MKILKITVGFLLIILELSTVANAEDFRFNLADKERNFILQYPDNSAGKPAPLVLIFHGGGGNSSFMQRKSTDITEQLLKAGYAVAFMNATGRFRRNIWKTTDCCGFAANENDGVDDLVYIDNAIDIITEKYAIDKGKIFLVGHSNGGMISYRAASLLHHPVKGVVAVSSAVFNDQPTPHSPFSLFMVHTKDDEILPYEGGMSTNKMVLKRQTRAFLAFEDAAHLWEKYLQCGQEQKSSLGNVALMLSANCADGNIIRVLELETGGHKWDKDLNNISLPQMIYNFIDEVAKKR